MPAKNEDLHGNAPDKADAALLLIDVINDLDFPDSDELLQHALPMAELLKPDKDDYFVLKPKHSGFYSTALDTLLDYLGTKVVILTGMAANICVLFTANDAYVRDFHLVVPCDCVASNTEAENKYALEQMGKILKADTRRSENLMDSLETLALSK